MMAAKTNIIRQEKGAKPVRVTSSRLFYRNTPKSSAVPEQTDGLLRKERDCCVRATD